MFEFYFIFLLVATISSFSDVRATYNSNNTLLEIPSQRDDEKYNVSTVEHLSKQRSIGLPSNNLEAYMSTVEIIVSRGYQAEMYLVTTDDGYILMLHRIPYPKGQNSGSTGRPVLIQHGFLESSADWVLNPSEESLAFILADLGYDVWLGNNRGSTYSRGHVTLDSDHDDAYWKFSFDEYGRYDMPALINKVLDVTDREKLLYIGFSSGCRVFFVCMHYHPGMNDKIELMVAMAPTTIRSNVAISLQIPLQATLLLLGDRSFASSSGLYSQFVKRYCLLNARLASLCHNALFLGAGVDKRNLSPSMTKIVDNHLPAGTSLRNMVHMSQNGFPSWQSPNFNQYNYGVIGNLRHYGQRNPPAYDLSKVTTPIYVFHAQSDPRASPKDVEWTVSRLPNVKQVVLVNDPKFSHTDFVFHRNVKVLVYDQIVALLPSS